MDVGTTFRPDKKAAYERAIETERNPQVKWVLEQVLANAEAAEENKLHFAQVSGQFCVAQRPECVISSHQTRAR